MCRKEFSFELKVGGRAVIHVYWTSLQVLRSLIGGADHFSKLEKNMRERVQYPNVRKSPHATMYEDNYENNPNMNNITSSTRVTYTMCRAIG